MAGGNPFAPPPSGGKSGGSGGGPDQNKLGAIARRIGKLSGGGNNGRKPAGGPGPNVSNMPPNKPNLAMNPGMFGG